VTDRAYFIVRTAATAGRSEVDHFVQWLVDESTALTSAAGNRIVKRRKSSARTRQKGRRSELR
jgi:hypothetical protein